MKPTDWHPFLAVLPRLVEGRWKVGWIERRFTFHEVSPLRFIGVEEFRCHVA